MTTATPSKSTAVGVIDAIDDGAFTLRVPGTSYRIRLRVDRPIETPVGTRISGVITARADRIDKIRAGGAYIEPIEGAPRRIQGRVLEIDKSQQTITVGAGAPIVCSTNDAQRAEAFEIGAMVTLDVKPGAVFTPAD